MNDSGQVIGGDSVVTGHVDTKITSWTDHKKAIENVEKNQRLLAGLLT